MTRGDHEPQQIVADVVEGVGQLAGDEARELDADQIAHFAEADT